jgi:predicted transcriptional regulator
MKPKKEKVLSVRLDAASVALFQEIADRVDLPLSTILRRALTHAIANKWTPNLK